MTSVEARRESQSQFSLSGRTAAVTGAGRGLGRGFALALAAAGADVVLLSRSPQELDEVASEIHMLGRLAWPRVCDVSDVAQIRTAFEGLPTLDVLVNNAGINAPQPFLQVEPEAFDRLLAVNLRGAFFVAQTAARAMLDGGRPGVIINVSSQMGHVGAANRSVYCASKHALEGLTRALAVELAQYGIRVNSVAPTYIVTAMTKPFLAEPDFQGEALRRIPLGRLGDIEDVTGAVLFLASPAAALITGASLLIDGGYTAQ